ncbi:DUF2726 domain-containing protein [Candidatus Parcubacteria bacterium]|nr:DUF2726 domain-containing protein [Candidatus Parcubacteria bacterium]
MSYYRRNYYRRKRKNPDFFDMIIEIIIVLFKVMIIIINKLAIFISELLFMFFSFLFNHKSKIKGLFKLKDKPHKPEVDLQVQSSNQSISGGEDTETIIKTDHSINEESHGKYSLKQSQVTPTEKNFLEILKQIVKDPYQIQSQVSLSSIISTKDSNNYADFNRIKAKSVDFVLFDNENKPCIAIELDDYTHLRLKRIKRDRFINDLMEEVGLRIVHVPVSNYYDIDELKKQIFLK